MNEALIIYLKELVSVMRQIRPNRNWKYGGFEELVLDCGTEMESQSLPKKIRRGLPKGCYWNCQRLIKKRTELIYVEGYAISPYFPFPTPVG